MCIRQNQGSYASGKCQGNLKFFKVRELSGNFIICQGNSENGLGSFLYCLGHAELF